MAGTQSEQNPAQKNRRKLEEELDRDLLVRDLTDAGWIRVPVVEDPGSFAIRGSLLDV